MRGWDHVPGCRPHLPQLDTGSGNFLSHYAAGRRGQPRCGRRSDRGQPPPGDRLLKIQPDSVGVLSHFARRQPGTGSASWLGFSREPAVLSRRLRLRAMRKRFYIFALQMLLAVSAARALDCFVLLDNIPGESIDPWHTNWIEATLFSDELIRSSPVGSA